jgi:hypothetical protein
MWSSRNVQCSPRSTGPHGPRSLHGSRTATPPVTTGGAGRDRCGRRRPRRLFVRPPSPAVEQHRARRRGDPRRLNRRRVESGDRVLSRLLAVRRSGPVQATSPQELSGVESYRLRFRPVVDGSVPNFTVALERPGGYPFPEYRFQSAEGYGWTLFEVPDLGAQSPGSFTGDFRFDLPEEVERLGVQVEMHATLDAGLDPRSYTAEALLTVHGPVPDGG